MVVLGAKIVQTSGTKGELTQETHPSLPSAACLGEAKWCKRVERRGSSPVAPECRLSWRSKVVQTSGTEGELTQETHPSLASAACLGVYPSSRGGAWRRGGRQGRRSCIRRPAGSENGPADRKSGPADRNSYPADRKSGTATRRAGRTDGAKGAQRRRSRRPLRSRRGGGRVRGSCVGRGRGPSGRREWRPRVFPCPSCLFLRRFELTLQR